MKTVLTIAGSDSIGGAGIQADLKTMCAHGVYGMTVITALTAQNTLGVQAIHTPPADFVRTEMASVFTDIQPDAVKIGMLANADIIRVIAEGLRKYSARNIVLDPVMVSTSRHRLLENDAESSLIKELMPLARLITPNLPEACELSGIAEISDRKGMVEAARQISAMTQGAILIKGGHLTDSADDLLYENGTEHWFSTIRLDTENTHGTGCTLSSAIASNLALGYTLADSVKRAKDYITLALQHDPHLGHGNGPLDHSHSLP